MNLSDDLIEARKNMALSAVSMSEFHSDVTILIQAFNRLEKTKECIESVLKYTKGINYDLMLIDSGSSDGTFEYFKSVEHDKVRILRLSKNITSSFPFNFINIGWIAKYLVTVTNDLIVTPNWLHNLITVAESDPKIGIVNPMSSNVSNCQCYDMKFTDFDDMQKKAAEFNISNPTKWHERMRIITLGTLFKKDCIYAIGFPIGDMGFFHDFNDDDAAFRARRAGYKVVLAKDTWIHHNHKVFQMENKNPEDFRKSLEAGRKNFNDKYFGIDAWDDVNNFIPEFLPAVEDTVSQIPHILGIDVRCGTPILEIKNKLREYGKFDSECFAFTQKAKYFIDLQSVCGAENVISDKIECLSCNFDNDSFDYIIIGNPINSYAEPYSVIRQAYKLLKPCGKLFISFDNAYDVLSFLYITGSIKKVNTSWCLNICIDDFYSKLNNEGYITNIIEAVPYNSEILSEEIINYLADILNKINVSDMKESLTRLITDKYAIEIIKPVREE